MTVFIRLLDVPTDDKPERLRAAVRGEKGLTVHRRPSDMVDAPGGAFVYWLGPELLKLFRSEGRWDEFDSRCGLATLDDFRFLRLWWEVPSTDDGWVPFTKGGGYSPFHADIVLKVNWHGGAEVKAAVERKVGSASRTVQGQDFYFRKGVTWPYLPHILGTFQVLPKGCIYSGGGRGIFAGNEEKLFELLSFLNSAPFLFLLESIMPRGSEGGQTLKYEIGYITSIPVPHVDGDLRLEMISVSTEGWKIGRDLACARETSLRFETPISSALERQLAGRMDEILTRCDSLALRALGVDEDAFPDMGAWSKTKRLQAARRSERLPLEVETVHLAWVFGRAFGRFKLVADILSNGTSNPFEALPSLPPAGQDESSAREIMVDDVGHDDDIVANMMPYVCQCPEIVVHQDPVKLRVWLANQFWSVHLAMYSAYRRKAPIYWQLATPSASYSVWLYYPKLTTDSLYRVQSDYTRPKLQHERSKLDKLRTEFGSLPSVAQRRMLEQQHRFVDELQTFDDEIGKVAAIWAPKLDDGVIVNFAPLWRLVSHDRSWQKELNVVWKALKEGKLDWANIALRLWPERVLEACSDDRSLAIAHGLEADLWQEGLPGKWTLRSSPRRPMADIIAQVSPPSVRTALSDYLAAAEPDATTRRTRRRA